jgi:hypothetical protein
VAVHFGLFDVLVKLAGEVSSKTVADEVNKSDLKRAEFSKLTARLLYRGAG